jgi:hypothetical protein
MVGQSESTVQYRLQVSPKHPKGAVQKAAPLQSAPSPWPVLTKQASPVASVSG